ncbi:MAG: thiamine pyrophosphate-binding protein, partial [Woeseiaceae bacterium]|nr:thiamine pyrophosphate-binding protein [Woeseiaceae bacterium]
MSGADIVIQVLADEGVDTIFGYSGGAILPTYDAVFRYNGANRRSDGSAAMPLIVPANEQGAGFGRRDPADLRRGVSIQRRQPSQRRQRG